MSRCRILKLGGSLLDLPDVAQRVQAWVNDNPAQLNLLIVGGGELIDAMRRLDKVHRLSTSDIHWACIDILRHTSKVLHSLLSNWGYLATEAELRGAIRHAEWASAGNSSDCLVVQVDAFYRKDAADDRLPQSWDTTTDALAALLARRVDADELVLFKSADPPAGDTAKNGQGALPTLNRWSEAGFVDPVFPGLVAGAPGTIVKAVNLRRLGGG